MRIIYGKNLTEREKKAALEISAKCGILYDTARLLIYRNIDTVEKAEKFLHPEKMPLYDPFDLSDMRATAERLSLAKNNGENVLVFGDYDADGVCASTILYFALKKFGINAFVTVPEREDGYGLNAEKVEYYRKNYGVSLLVTVDCGISDYEKIQSIKSTGVDVIVTDHHEPPAILPDCLKINPKIAGQAYPFDGLCGAGVAFKLASALIGDAADEFLDLAALATVADSMDLIDENRVITARGLKLMNGRKRRSVFNYLSGGSGGSEKKLTSQTLAFGVAPRVNAGGRMGDACSALKAFIGTDEAEVFDYCVRLNRYNLERQADCDAIYREAKAKINSEKSYLNSVILVEKEGWTTGFIGIVAAKLVEDYNRPVIVFARSGDFMKGSARSVEGFNIYDAICAAKDFSLGFGGHSQAAGVSVSAERYAEFGKAVCDYASEMLTGRENEKEIFVDIKAKDKLSMRFVKEIELLEPFGVGNRRPLFSVETGSVTPKPLKVGSTHYSFATAAMEMLDFNGAADVTDLALNVKKEIIFEPNYSVFRNVETVKGFVKHIIPDYGDFSAASLKIFDNELKKLKSGGASDYKEIHSGDVRLTKGSGTAYLVSDERNLKNYALNGLKTYLFEKREKSNVNCVIVSPTALPDGYDKAIYLDVPSLVFPCGEARVCVDFSGTSRLGLLSVDRSDFEAVFRSLCELNNEKFDDPASFCEQYADVFADGFTGGVQNAEEKGLGFNGLIARVKRAFDGRGICAEQFVFSTEVFFELGFFEIKDGRLKRNAAVKSALNNSKIYNAVCALKVKI